MQHPCIVQEKSFLCNIHATFKRVFSMQHPSNIQEKSFQCNIHVLRFAEPFSLIIVIHLSASIFDLASAKFCCSEFSGLLCCGAEIDARFINAHSLST